MKKYCIFICLILCSCAEEGHMVLSDLENHIIKDMNQTPSSEILQDSYGICAHITRPQIDYPYIDSVLRIADELGCTWVRSDLDWWSISSRPGEVDYSLFDSVFSHIDKHPNIHLLPIIVSRGNYNGEDNKVQILEYYEEWETYVSSVVERYHDRCPAWEGLNELDYQYIDNNLFDYSDGVEFQKFIYNTVKSYDPDASVLFGSMVSINSYNTFTGYGSLSYHDISNIHIFSEKQPEFDYSNKLMAMTDILKENGYNKNIWVTETGWSTAPNYLTKEEQAYLIPRAFITGFSLGIDKIFLYNLRSRDDNSDIYESSFGILNADFSPKPAFYSFKNLIKMLPDGSTRPKMYTDGSIYISSWIHPEKGKIYAIWKYEGNSTISLTIEGNPHFYRYDNLETEIQIPDFMRVPIREEILYITGATSIIPSKI